MDLDPAPRFAAAASSAAIPDLKRGIALEAPPRRLSPAMWLQVTFGRFHCGFGAVFSFPLLTMPLMDQGPLPVLFVSIFPIIGMTMFVFGVRKGLRGVRLLREGMLGYGTFVDEKPTSTKINDVTVMEMRFRFNDDTGRERFAVTRTHLTAPLRDQAAEPLLYERGDDARRPAGAPAHRRRQARDRGPRLARRRPAGGGARHGDRQRRGRRRPRLVADVAVQKSS